MQTYRLNVFLCALALGISAVASGAPVEGYPNRPVRFVVTFPPGGANDIIARILGQKLSEQLGQPFIVDNRPGASGIVGIEIVGRANADGYTIMMAPTAFTVLPSLYPKMAFTLARNFTPISLAAVIPNILVVHPSVPATSVKELIALAKAKPGQLLFADAGIGGSVHLAAELFRSMARIDIVHVPYKGGPPALNDLLGGRVHMMFPDALASLPHIRSGKVRPLGTTGSKRLAAAPTVPTIAEAGLPGYQSVGWYGVVAPAGTPQHIINTLSTAITQALRSSDVSEKLAAQAAEPIGNGPKEFGAYIGAETEKWAKVVREAGIKLE